MAVAGTPETYGYDPDTRTFTLNYTPDPAIAAPTLVFTAPRQYPGGYRVEIDGGRIVSADRSEEHTSELQSLMRISYAVFCLKKKNYTKQKYHPLKQPLRLAY